MSEADDIIARLYLGLSASDNEDINRLIGFTRSYYLELANIKNQGFWIYPKRSIEDLIFTYPFVRLLMSYDSPKFTKDHIRQLMRYWS